MPAPVSPKKRSLMPSGELRRKLRGHGHALTALLQVGKAGVTKGFVDQLTQTLFDHELVKVKVAAECPADRFAVAERLGGEPGVDVVQVLGRTILLYKRHPQTPRFEGKRAADPGAETPVTPPVKAKPKRKPKGKARAKLRGERTERGPRRSP